MKRRFATILTITMPPDAADASSKETAALRASVERQLGSGLRVLVVPVLTPYGETTSAITARLQGIAHDMGMTALMPDDRFVAWILARADAK